MTPKLDEFDAFALFVVIAAAALMLSLLAGACGCAPETDLAAQVGTPGGDVPAPGPGGAALVDPVAGATGVPVNLAAVVLRFPAAVSALADALRVCDGAGGPVPVSPPEEVACPGVPAQPGTGACYRAALGGSLPAAASCRVELGAGALDAGGQPVAAGLVGVFDTAAAADDVPPVLTGVTVEVAGPCIGVRFATDEPATGAVILRAGEVEAVVPAGAGQTDFDVAVPSRVLPALAEATVTARAIDRAGNLVESAPFSLTTPAPTPSLAITEILPNPVGPEPGQEYVEIRNLGDEALPLDGISIQDSRGADALPAETLAPAAYALVVTSSYDPASGADPPPRAGTLLLRVDSRIGTDGLSNGGELVRLVQGDTVVSSYGGWVDASSTKWAGRGVHRLVQNACDRPDAWNRTPLDATPGGAPP